MGKFNKDIAKKVSLQTIGGGDGPSDSQGIEIKSPGKMFWFTIKGITYEDITEVITTKLYDSSNFPLIFAKSSRLLTVNHILMRNSVTSYF